MVSYAHSKGVTHWGQGKIDAISQITLFKCIFSNENVWIPIKILLKFVPKGTINNIPAINGADNGLALSRWQANIWTNDV